MSDLKTTAILNMSLVLFQKTRIRSQIIYSIMLLSIALSLSILPFLYVTISVKGSGVMKSDLDITELLAPASGRVLSLNLTDNKKVTKGATLLVIDGTLSKQQRSLLNVQRTELHHQVNDAEQLIKVVNREMKSKKYYPRTGLYRASWQHYTEQFKNATNVRQQAERIYQRYQTLYQKRVVTKAEFEQYEFNFKQAFSDQQMVNKKYENQWRREINENRKELGSIQNQQAQLNDQEKQYRLLANVNGSIQNLTGVLEGSYIYANQKIGEISPDGILFAFCYVKPSDIALVKKGQSVRIQVDAFNYNRWGMAMAKVMDISEDIIIIDHLPYFRIKCKVDKQYLQLKSGYKGFIIKGMTFNARFSVARRSLSQLLYDKVNDWVN